MSVKTIGNLPIMYIGDVEKATSKPRPSIYRESREGTFPIGQTLTHLDAWILSHTSRLAAHIHKLRELGWSIDTIPEPVACGDGRTAHIARYQLIEPHEVVGDEKVRAFVESVTQARLSGK